MAAPKIPTSQRKANLSTLSAKEKSPKVTRKNILCPVSQEWPRVSKNIEDYILTKLTENLTSSTNIVKHIKKSSADDKSEKTRIRSQLEIGTSAVFRALERDELACVLISGKATPAITVDHIISLARDQGCPLLCLDQLAPTVARATKSKCLPLAVGFKKTDNSHSEFAEVISLVRSNTTTSSPQKKVNMSATQLVSGGVQPGKTNKNRPVQVCAEAGQEILAHLIKTLSQGLLGNTDKEKKKMKKKKQRKKKNLKDVFERVYLFQFDIGKRTVARFLERGKYEIILVSKEIAPVLLTETQPFSLLSVAAVKKCPVVVLPGLVDAMRPLCGGIVSVLGLKKLSSFPDDQKHFQQVIDSCFLAIRNMNEQQLSQADHQESTGQSFSPTESEPAVRHEPCLTEQVPAISMDIADIRGSQSIGNTSDKKRLHEKDGALISTNNEVSGEDKDIEDYSYLYIMKAESKELADVKNELKALTASFQNDPFSADYISLSTKSNESRFQSSSSSGKQKGHFSKNQKPEPTLADKSTSSASKKPKTIALDSSTVSKQTEFSEQQKDNFIPFTETSTSDSQSVVHEAVSRELEVDTPRIKLSSEEASFEAPLFTICRSGNSSSQSNTVETTLGHHTTDKLATVNKEDETVKVKVSPQVQSETAFFSLCGSGNPVSESNTVDITPQKQRDDDDKFKPPNKEDKTVKLNSSPQVQSETPFFSLCRSGNPVSTTNKVSQQKRPHNDSQLTNVKEDKATMGVQGLRAAADSKYTGIDFLSLDEPTKDANKAVKRKLHRDQSYISFAYTESNIQTMVSNQNKKKKKKKQKK